MRQFQTIPAAALVVLGAVILWLMGYRYNDDAAILFMTAVIVAVGAFLLKASRIDR